MPDPQDGHVKEQRHVLMKFSGQLKIALTFDL